MKFFTIIGSLLNEIVKAATSILHCAIIISSYAQAIDVIMYRFVVNELFIELFL